MSNEKKIPISRKKLLSVAKNVAKIVLQFLTQLSTKGINQQYLDALKGDIESVSKLKTDDQLADELSSVNLLLISKCKSCHKWGMKLKTYLQRAFGKKGNELMEFPPSFEDSKRDPKEMINTMPQVIALANKYKDTLLTRGMDADFIETGEMLLSELDLLNTDKDKMESDNKSYGVMRNMAQYNLYEKINYINSIGREKFENDPVNKKYFESPWKIKTDDKDDEEGDEIENQPGQTGNQSSAPPAK